MAAKPPEVEEERRNKSIKRRKSDMWMPILISLGLVLLLVTAVASTVAFLGVNKAEDAASRAERAAKTAETAINRTAKNSATIDDLCLIVRQQKEEVRLGVTNTEQFLESPVAEEIPGFSAYIAQVSLPQARLRLKNFFVPDSCAGRLYPKDTRK